MKNHLKKVNNDINLKPGALTEILKISDQTLRYWRKHLDPRQDKRNFTGKDILMYSVFNLMIRAEQVPVRELKGHNWDKIFEFCYSATIKTLLNSALVYDAFTKSLFIAKNASDIDLDDNWIHCVKFKVARKNIINAFDDKIKDNIIYPSAFNLSGR